MKRALFRYLTVLTASTVVALVGCAGGGGGNFYAPPNPTQSPTPVQTPAVIVPSTTSISFNGSAAQTISVSEAGYTGTFTATSSNTDVAVVSAGPDLIRRNAGATSSGAFTITPIGGGTATITISDQSGHTTTIAVAVTGLTVITQGKH